MMTGAAILFGCFAFAQAPESGRVVSCATQYAEPPPDAVPDMSATSQSSLIDAWNGTGLTPETISSGAITALSQWCEISTYMLAAARRKSGITSLDSGLVSLLRN
jgi:hypothetical protein